MGENKMDKTGKECGFREGKKCGEECGLFCVGLRGCVAHSINMHIKEVADRGDRRNQLLSFIDKKMGANNNPKDDVEKY